MEPKLSDFPVQVTIPVQWAEMDAYGHLNNAVYFRYFEVARIHLLERIGFLGTYETDGIGAILHSTSCRFRMPLRYPATARVGTRVSRVDGDRFTQQYIVLDEDDNVVAEGVSVVVSFDYRKGIKTPIPDAVKAAMGGVAGDPDGETNHPYR